MLMEAAGRQWMACEASPWPGRIGVLVAEHDERNDPRGETGLTCEGSRRRGVAEATS